MATPTHDQRPLRLEGAGSSRLSKPADLRGVRRELGRLYGSARRPRARKSVPGRKSGHVGEPRVSSTGLLGPPEECKSSSAAALPVVAVCGQNDSGGHLGSMDLGLNASHPAVVGRSRNTLGWTDGSAPASARLNRRLLGALRPLALPTLGPLIAMLEQSSAAVLFPMEFSSRPPRCADGRSGEALATTRDAPTAPPTPIIDGCRLSRSKSPFANNARQIPTPRILFYRRGYRRPPSRPRETIGR